MKIVLSEQANDPSIHTRSEAAQMHQRRIRAAKLLAEISWIGETPTRRGKQFASPARFITDESIIEQTNESWSCSSRFFKLFLQCKNTNDRRFYMYAHVISKKYGTFQAHVSYVCNYEKEIDLVLLMDWRIEDSLEDKWYEIIFNCIYQQWINKTFLEYNIKYGK